MVDHPSQPLAYVFIESLEKMWVCFIQNNGYLIGLQECHFLAVEDQVSSQFIVIVASIQEFHHQSELKLQTFHRSKLFNVSLDRVVGSTEVSLHILSSLGTSICQVWK